jgi:hypothetical protein
VGGNVAGTGVSGGPARRSLALRRARYAEGDALTVSLHVRS